MNTNFKRIMMAGPVSSGKSHLTLTCEPGIFTLYSDRLGGDEDLQGLEDAGVHVHQVNLDDPKVDMLAQIAELRSKKIKALGIKWIVWDSSTYTSKQQKMKRSNNNLMAVENHQKAISFDVQDICNALFQLPANILIIAHIKEAIERDRKTKEVISRKWAPDIPPAIMKEISREVSLVGYTWKKAEPGKPTRYGICFTHRMGNMEFMDVKSPDGWGPAEPANIRMLCAKLEAEAATKRQRSIEALKSNIDQTGGVAPGEEPETAKEADDTPAVDGAPGELGL